MQPDLIAFFVSPHGFGHAARAAAVIEALHTRRPELRFAIFTTVPRWFFEESLTPPFGYVRCHTDVGLVQTSPMDEDLSATIDELDSFLPLSPESIRRHADDLAQDGCRLVVSDISPLGIAAAAELDLPCALIENFTWDWIYRAYLDREPRFEGFITELQELYASVSLRIQAEPFCAELPGAARTHPISRPIRQSPREVRRQLGLPPESPLVLLTMGGFPASYRFLRRLHRYPEIRFVVPGGTDRRLTERNVVRLPHRTGFQHADLVNAADLVVGKLGYSTLAEVSQAATAFLFLPRRHFPESPILARHAEDRLRGAPLTQTEFESAEWPDRLPALQRRGRTRPVGRSGADQAADLLLDLLTNS